MRLRINELARALVKLDDLLDKHRIGYAVVGGWAYRLLGVPTVEPSDIDILVSGEDMMKLNAIIRRKRNITVPEPIRWREEGVVKGLNGGRNFY